MLNEEATNSRIYSEMPRNGAIDVVRGIAITLVILYHLPGNPVNGGLIGVDLFMVLSGYLVTKSLLGSSLTKSELLEFWRRRIRRVLPAVTSVVCVVAVIRFIFWTVSRKEDLWDAASAIGLVANWRFISSGRDYFRTVGGVSPYQHLWSLSVEEQFYVFWPIVVLIARKHLSKVIGLLIGASFIWMMIESSSTSLSRAYFGTDTRIGTLLIGSSLAIWEINNRSQKNVNWSRIFQFSLTGFVLISVFANATDKSMYQGGFLLVALFAAFIVFCASRLAGNSKIEKLWGSSFVYRCLRSLGLRSYSLYLVHWPVFVLITPQRFDASETELLLYKLLLTFLCSEILYRFIEEPWRRISTTNRRMMYGLVLATTSIGLAISVAAINVAPSPKFLQGGNSSVIRTHGENSGTLLIGDSIVEGLMEMPSIESAATAPIDYIAVSGCGFLPGFVIGSDGSVYEPSRNCPERVDDALWKALKNHRYKKIIWLNAWDAEDREIDGKKLRQTIDGEAFTNLMQSVILRLQTFAQEVTVVTIPEKAFKSSTYSTPPDQLTRDRYKASRKNLLKAARLAKSSTIDLAQYICKKSSPCDDFDSSGSRFRPIDGVHFSGPGGKNAKDWLVRQISDVPKN